MASEVQSVLRAFAVLRTLAAHPAPVPLAAIAEETDLPKSTVNRLLRTLESVAVVERGDVAGSYTLGPGIEALSGRPTSTAQLIAVVDPYLTELVDRYGEDAGLAVPDGREVLFVHQVMSPNPVQVQDWTGMRFPPHVVAPGHVIMATWTDDQLEAYLARSLARATDRTVTDPDELSERVHAARKVGYAWTFEEWAEGINGVAAPIHDPNDALVGAINLYGPAYRFPGEVDAAGLGRELTRTARLAARHLATE